MRTVFVFPAGGRAETVASLDRHLPQQRVPWTLGGNLYIDIDDERAGCLFRDWEPDDVAALDAAIGQHPTWAVTIDISGRVDGTPEVHRVTALLLEDGGVAVDEYSAHPWTLQEIESGTVIDGRRFFDSAPVTSSTVRPGDLDRGHDNPLALAGRDREDQQVNTLSDVETVTLWRPTGPEELALVEASGWRQWPPRLRDQPIFYPVLNPEYATMIARDWNVKHSGSGYVTRFYVRRGFLDNYETHQVGGRAIIEYWIPAEDLAALNANIVGLIEVVAEYHRD